MVTELGTQEKRGLTLTGMMSQFSTVNRIDRALEAFYLYQSVSEPSTHVIAQYCNPYMPPSITAPDRHLSVSASMQRHDAVAAIC